MKSLKIMLSGIGLLLFLIGLLLIEILAVLDGIEIFPCYSKSMYHLANVVVLGGGVAILIMGTFG